MILTDYIHFYVGAKVLHNNVVSTITGFRQYDAPGDGKPVPVVFYENKELELHGKTKLKDCKLLLIPITQLTQDDFRMLDTIYQGTLEEFKEVYNQYLPYFSADDTLYLVKKGYDVFDLIEKGVALDITVTEYAKV